MILVASFHTSELPCIFVTGYLHSVQCETVVRIGYVCCEVMHQGLQCQVKGFARKCTKRASRTVLSSLRRSFCSSFLMSASSAAAADGVGAAAAAAEPRADAGSVLDIREKTDILGNIKRLKDQAALLREQKKVVSKQLKNEEKRRKRLRERARQLTDNDLLALLKMREAAANNAEDAIAPSSSSSAASSAAGDADAGVAGHSPSD